MKTNLKELLNNTNLTPIQILKYYEEEITNELEIYKNMYWSCLDFCKKAEFEEQKNKIANLILEFTALIKYLTTIHYKNVFFSSSIKDKIEELEYEVKCNPKYLHVVTIVEYKCQIIKEFYNDLSKYLKSKSYENERLSALAQEKEDIEEFYVAELNRLLDEKETKIYELEYKSFQDEQDINALINENNELRRVLEINREGEE